MELTPSYIYEHMWRVDGYWFCISTIEEIKNEQYSCQIQKSIRKRIGACIEHLEKGLVKSCINCEMYENPYDASWSNILCQVQKMYPKQKIYFPDICSCNENCQYEYTRNKMKIKSKPKQNQEMITIYTDGSCNPNPGVGGWGYIEIGNDYLLSDSGGEEKSTNNRMEMKAVIEALKAYKTEKNFLIYSDSQYVIKCATGVNKRRKNRDLWSEYDKVSKGKNIKFKWVHSHNGDKYNEMVDELAKEGRLEI